MQGSGKSQFPSGKGQLFNITIIIDTFLTGVPPYLHNRFSRALRAE